MGGTATEESAPVGETTAAVYPVDARVAGRYRVVRFLAAGGSGVVYEAEDLVLGDMVALKTLRIGLESSERAIERLRREIALARRITHRNVCRIHDVGEHDGRVFLTMELLRGESLAERVRRAPLALAEIDAIARQLVAALSAAHAAGVVHRDFKTANVMLTPEPAGIRAVVCDFGLARSTVNADDGFTNEAALVGTPAYMAPEQVEGHAATPASDIYSLGVVLYELATGTVPFRGDTVLATATARLHRAPPRPSATRRDLDRRLEAAIMRCLAREPSQRFECAGDVLAERGSPRRSARRATVVAITIAIAILIARSAEDDEPDVQGPPRHWPSGVRPVAASAAAYFDQAHAALVYDDWLTARERLELSVASSTNDTIAQVALGEVLASLGLYERAHDAGRRAMETRSGVAEQPRLFVEAQTALIRGETELAIGALRRLIAIAPEERVYRLQLATVLADARPAEAAQLLTELGSAVGDGEAIQVELVRASIAGAQRDPRSQSAHADIAVQRATTAQRRHDRARASIVAASARLSLDDATGATSAYEAALSDAVAVGHSGAILRARDALIHLDTSAGRLRRAIERRYETIALVRTLGDRKRLFDELKEAARSLVATGQLDDANVVIEDARQIALELASEPHLGWVDALGALVAMQRGQLAEAARLAELAFERARRAGVSGLAGVAFHLWAESLIELDDADALARAWAARGPSVDRLVDCYAAFRHGDLDRAERIASSIANWRTREGRDAQVVIAHVLVKRRTLDAAERLLDRAAPLLIGDGASLLGPQRLFRTRAELLARRADLRSALAILDGQTVKCAAAALRSCEFPSAALAIELVAPSDPAEAMRRAATLVPRARALGFHRIAREVAATVQRNGSADSP